MATVTAPVTGAEEVRWDLTDLYSAPDDPRIDQDMQKTHQYADAFAEDYRGRVAQLTADEMLAALKELEEIYHLETVIGSYAFLAWSTAMTDPVWGKLVAKVQQFGNEINQKLLFFELEWANAPEAAAAKLLNDPQLQHYTHFLRIARLYQPHTLSEPEEKILSETAQTGAQAWSRYFGEFHSRLKYPFEGQELTQSEILNKLRQADRETRRQASDVITDVLRNNLHTTAFVYNMMLLDKQSKDKLRKYKTWLSSRNLSNQVEDEPVEALIQAVTSRYDLVSRYYDLLKRLLGYDKLYDYDRYAPIEKKKSEVHWNQAREIVQDAFTKFSPRIAEVSNLFFEKHWIDAAAVPGKRGGAYSATGSARVHPYVFMNYMGDTDSVMTLAHELGHGVHQYLSREQGELMNNTPLTTAEMASTFGEMLVFDSLVAREDNPEVRLSMRLSKIVDTIATVYRQISMNRFEHAIHTARREQGELSSDQLNEFWLKTQRDMHSNSVELRDDYGLWWSYIPHMINTPGYVYAYAFGDLLVWALYAKYQQSNNGFAEAYVDALRAGGSDYPHEILKPLGVDLRDPKFWHEGIGLLEQFIAETEKEAKNLGY